MLIGSSHKVDSSQKSADSPGGAVETLSVPHATTVRRKKTVLHRRFAFELTEAEYQAVKAAAAKRGYTERQYGASLNVYAKLILLAHHGLTI